MVRRTKRVERGAAAVEMALVLPVLLLLIGGIVDFGRAFFTQIMLDQRRPGGCARAASSRERRGASHRCRVDDPGMADTDVPGDCVATPTGDIVVSTSCTRSRTSSSVPSGSDKPNDSRINCQDGMP